VEDKPVAGDFKDAPMVMCFAHVGLESNRRRMVPIAASAGQEPHPLNWSTASHNQASSTIPSLLILERTRESAGTEM
jgi:hypothetical protein